MKNSISTLHGILVCSIHALETFIQGKILHACLTHMYILKQNIYNNE